jgi:hypothetical protein
MHRRPSVALRRNLRPRLSPSMASCLFETMRRVRDCISRRWRRKHRLLPAIQDRDARRGLSAAPCKRGKTRRTGRTERDRDPASCDFPSRKVYSYNLLHQSTSKVLHYCRFRFMAFAAPGAYLIVPTHGFAGHEGIEDGRVDWTSARHVTYSFHPRRGR